MIATVDWYDMVPLWLPSKPEMIITEILRLSSSISILVLTITASE